jgi:hypothetical protein
MAVNLPRYGVILDTFAFRNRSTVVLACDSRYVPYGVHMSQPAFLVLSRSCTDTQVSIIFFCTADIFPNLILPQRVRN